MAHEITDIAITGIGLITPLGAGREIFWENCRRAKSGIKKITAFDTSKFDSDMAGVIDDFDPGKYMPVRAYRRMSRISRLAVSASVEALEDSGLDPDGMDKSRMAVILGTAYGSSSHVEDFYVSLLNDGPRGARPFLFPETVPNAPASHIAMFHGITGPNTTFCQNQISAENAILYARNLLLQGRADVVLVGGADELSEIQFACYHALGVLNTSIPPETGGGLVLGEGAGVLVMERIAHAIGRQARIYGMLAGGVISGNTTDMGHYDTTGDAVARAASLSLKQAGITPGEVDHIDVSANFSPELDPMEYRFIQSIFQDHTELPAVTPIKYLTGDFGGCGSVRAAGILLSLFHQQSLPTVPAKALNGDYGNQIPWHVAPSEPIRSTLMTSSTFGGGSAGLVFQADRHSI